MPTDGLGGFEPAPRRVSVGRAGKRRRRARNKIAAKSRRKNRA